MGRDMGALVCVDDFEAVAQQTLAKSVYDYYRSGADEQLTLRRNIAAFKRYLIRPRLLRDVSRVDTTVTLLANTLLSFPIAIAPTAFHCMAHPEGERATARAAAKTDTLMISSTISTTSLEEIAAAAPEGVRWFQLYVYKDREATRRLVQRAEKAGFKALVLTADTPQIGKRRQDARNAFTLPSHLKFGNFLESNEKGVMEQVEMGTSGFNTYVEKQFDASLTWTDVRWLTSLTSLPVIVKGVLTAQDAISAYQHGAQAVIVSNHGARQLDSVPATLEVLAEVAGALEQRCDVYLDGGVRTGTDILKALALGAKAVFLGRPIIWGLAVHGEEGVVKVLRLLQEEFKASMQLAGFRSIQEINRTSVVHENFYSKL